MTKGCIVAMASTAGIFLHGCCEKDEGPRADAGSAGQFSFEFKKIKTKIYSQKLFFDLSFPICHFLCSTKFCKF